MDDVKEKEIRVIPVSSSDLRRYAQILQEELGYSEKEALDYLHSHDVECIWKVEIDTEAVGFMIFTIQNDTLYIDDIDVVKQWRLCGFGSLLLQAAEKEAKRRNINKIWLHVSVTNEVALKFYQKNGYVVEKRVIGYYMGKYDAYIVSKVIN